MGILLGFIQAEVTRDRNAGITAIRSLWRFDYNNFGDVRPSIDAARRISQGLPTYQSFSEQGASFIYPPIAAIYYRPLLGLSDREARMWLFIVNRALLLGIFVLLFFFSRPPNSRPLDAIRIGIGLCIALLLWHPIMRAIELNQASVLITFLLGASWFAVRNDKEILAGIGLALAIAIKPPLILGLPLLFWHARRTLLATLITGVGLLGSSIVYAGWASHREYFMNVMPALTPGYAFYPNQSWNGLICRLLHPASSMIFAIAPNDSLVKILSMVLGGATLLLFGLRIRSLPRNSALRHDILGLSWLAATLASPIAWEHHYASAIFPLVWLFRRHGTTKSLTATPGISWLLAFSAILMGSYFEIRTLNNPLSLLAASYVFLGAILFALGWFASLDEKTNLPWILRLKDRLMTGLIPLPMALQVRVEIMGLAACLVLAFYLLGHLLLFQYGRDQGIYAVVARAVHAGGVPYRDAWDFRPPGIFFIFALARSFFGQGMASIRILEALGVLSILPAFIIISRRFINSWKPAVPAFAFAVMSYGQLGFWHTAQPESFAAIFLCWALAFSAISTPSEGNRPASSLRSAVSWLFIGICYGCAGVLKPLLAGGILLTPFLLGCSRVEGSGVNGARLRASLGPFLLLFLGATLPIVATLLYFVSNDAFAWLIDTLVRFGPDYCSIDQKARWFWPLFAQGWLTAVFRFSRHAGVGLLLLIALPKIAHRERMGLAHILVILFFPLLGVGLQAQFFPAHYGTIIPILTLPVAWGFWKLWLKWRTRLIPILFFIIALLTLRDQRILPPYAAPLWDSNWLFMKLLLGQEDQQQGITRLIQRGPDINYNNRRVAQWIAKTTKPDQAIFVWGGEPMLYDLADRPFSTRYIYNLPLRLPGAFQYRQSLMADLTRTSPAVVVVEEGDILAHITGDELDSKMTLRYFPELQTFLDRGYRSGPKFGNLSLYYLR